MCDLTSPFLTSVSLITRLMPLRLSAASLALTTNSSPLRAHRASPSDNAISVSMASASISSRRSCPSSLHNGHTQQLIMNSLHCFTQTLSRTSKNSQTRNIPILSESHNTGNSLKTVNHHCHYNIRKYSFSAIES